jgi:6-phosphogluconate dehydrogenase
MSFVQMFQFTTSDVEGIRRVDEEWRKVRREVIAADRNQPGRYFAIVFFDSYESAMENSNLPETQAAAAKYMELSDGQPVFYDLDVIEDRT